MEWLFERVWEAYTMVASSHNPSPDRLLSYPAFMTGDRVESKKKSRLLFFFSFLPLAEHVHRHAYRLLGGLPYQATSLEPDLLV